MKTEIKEFELKNGKINFDVYYDGAMHTRCRTLKSAKATAEKLEKFNGSFYATHLRKNKHFILCNTRGDQTTTDDKSKVTCPRCLAKMGV